MILLTALFVALLMGSGFYLLMRKNFFEVLLGTAMLSHGVNLFLMAMSGHSHGQRPPLLVEGEKLPPDVFVDPLPQALILTAIVISFGVSAYLFALAYRGVTTTKTDELGEAGQGGTH